MQINSVSMNAFQLPTNTSKPNQPGTQSVNAQRDAGGEKSTNPTQQAAVTGVSAEQRVSAPARAESTERTMQVREPQAQSAPSGNKAINQYMQAAQGVANQQLEQSGIMGIDVYV